MVVNTIFTYTYCFIHNILFECVLGSDLTPELFDDMFVLVVLLEGVLLKTTRVLTERKGCKRIVLNYYHKLFIVFSKSKGYFINIIELKRKSSVTLSV